MPDIIVSEDIRGAAMDELRQRYDVAFEPDLWQDPDRLLQLIDDARALLVRNQTRVTADVIAAGPRLIVIGRAGAGLDNIDTNAATEAGVVVTFTPSENAISVAELTIGFMLSLSRELPAADVSTKAGGWERKRFTGVELYGKTLGLVGYGRIARLVAERAQAFGMTIVAFDPYLDEADAQLLPLDEVLVHSDYVSCHMPATAETRGMLSRERLTKMKPSAFFINAARGEVVDESALIEALQDKRIAGAALDVRADEPPATGGLNDMPNVILTPHVGAFTHEAQDRVVASMCLDIATVLDGQPAANAFAIASPARS